MSKLTREDYYKSTRVSNSSLSWLLPESGGSPAKYEELSLFPSEQEDSQAMLLGSHIHKLLEKKTLNVFQETETPSAAVTSIAETVVENLPNFDKQPPAIVEEELIKTARAQGYHNDWKDVTLGKNLTSAAGIFMLQLFKAKKDGISLVDKTTYDTLKIVLPKLEKLLPWNFDKSVDPPMCEGDHYEILNELIVEFDLLGVPCKAMIDLVVINKSKGLFQVYDLKTTSTPLSIYFGHTMSAFVEDSVSKSRILADVEVPGTFLKWQVHRQMAFYNRAVQARLGYHPMGSPVIIGCETKMPYEVQLRSLTYEELTIGDARVLKAIEMIDAMGLNGVGL
jgi:hypothetical protein